jgi:hypothetical protein
VHEGPRDRPLLELPPDDALVSVAAMYRSIWHRRPLVNPYSGHIAPHYAILSHALRRGDVSPLRVLSRPHGLTVAIDRGSSAEFATLVAAIPGAQPSIAGSAGIVFELPAAPPLVAAPATAPLTATAQDAGSERLVLDLGAVHRVDSVTFDLLSQYRDLPERMVVERSEDAVMWQEV